ncbi:obscurin isoform X2 [Silurus meridionalis]|nr:obscurin isoform X2 [Silurus meridionalis]
MNGRRKPLLVEAARRLVGAQRGTWDEQQNHRMNNGRIGGIRDALWKKKRSRRESAGGKARTGIHMSDNNDRREPTYTNNNGRDVYSELQVCELLTQLLSGVDYLHRCHILHLDLRSDNVLVTERNVVKIVDLGSAQFFTPGHALNIEHIKKMSESKDLKVKNKCKGHTYMKVVNSNFTEIDSNDVLMSSPRLSALRLSGDSPFHSEFHWERDRNVRKGKIQFGRCYPGLSEGAINFLKSTLNSKARERPSAAECLQNPWLRGGKGEQSKPTALMFCFSTDKLQAFLKQHELKRERARTRVTLPLS